MPDNFPCRGSVVIVHFLCHASINTSKDNETTSGMIGYTQATGATDLREISAMYGTAGYWNVNIFCMPLYKVLVESAKT